MCADARSTLVGLVTHLAPSPTSNRSTAPCYRSLPWVGDLFVSLFVKPKQVVTPFAHKSCYSNSSLASELEQRALRFKHYNCKHMRRELVLNSLMNIKINFVS